jgi:ubiquinone/menaquinone biosynthesis C-methylase UbiE
LVYAAVGRRDAVFTAGQFIAFFIYARNIALYRKNKTSVKKGDDSNQSGNVALSMLEQGQSEDFSNDYRLHSLFSMVPRSGGRLLDIGSGNGEIANFLRGAFYHFTLADISSYLCENLRKKFNGRRDVSVIQIDGQSFSLGSILFDGVTMTDVIEHTDNDRKALENAYTVLKPGGFLFVSVPALPFLYGIRDKDAGHYRRYVKKDLKQKILNQGFRMRSIRYWNLLGVIPYFVFEKMIERPISGPMRRPRGFMSRVANRMIYIWLLVESKILFLPLGLTLVVVAEKPHDAR